MVTSKYEKYFETKKILKVLEIGLQVKSLLMWSDYFKYIIGIIHKIDIKKKNYY